MSRMFSDVNLDDSPKKGDHSSRGNSRQVSLEAHAERVSSASSPPIDGMMGVSMSSAEYRSVLVLFLTVTLWTLILTAIPILTTVGPDNYYPRHPGWFTGDDIIRFIEPIGGVPFNFVILYRSGIFESNQPDARYAGACMFTFMVGAALCAQGGGYHSASNMFQNCLETLDLDDDGSKALFYYMRMFWQHQVSHYIYALGYLLMQAAQCWAFKNHEMVDVTVDAAAAEAAGGRGGLPGRDKALLLIAAAMHGLLIAGVSINFPSGLIVGLALIGIFGLAVLGGFMYFRWRHHGDDRIAILGGRPIIHFFFLSNMFALVVILIWIAASGFQSRSDAGVS